MPKTTGIALGLVLFATLYASPKSIGWSRVVAALIGVPLSWIVCKKLLSYWRLRHHFHCQPRAPLFCPMCGSGKHEFKAGVWVGKRSGDGASRSWIVVVRRLQIVRDAFGQAERFAALSAIYSEWSRQIEVPDARRAAEVARWTEQHACRTDAS